MADVLISRLHMRMNGKRVGRTVLNHKRRPKLAPPKDLTGEEKHGCEQHYDCCREHILLQGALF